MNRTDRETARTVGCHFCEGWKLTLTEVDLKGDTIDAYDRHLRRHAEALTPEALELAVFNALIAPLDHP